MKKSIYTFSLLLLATISYSQTCTRNVTTWVKANGGYAINGTATFTNENGKQTISLDKNFSTVSGPDLHLYLAKSNESPVAAGNTNVVISLLQSNTGAQSFEVPQNVKITDYEYVLIHCLAGNHFWGGGKLNTIVGTCPSVAGLEDEIITPSIHFNSENNLLTINNVNNNTQVNIYDLLGNKIYDNISAAPISMNGKSAGIYIVRLILAENSQYSYKFYKE